MIVNDKDTQFPLADTEFTCFLHFLSCALPPTLLHETSMPLWGPPFLAPSSPPAQAARPRYGRDAVSVRMEQVPGTERQTADKEAQAPDKKKGDAPRLPP